MSVDGNPDATAGTQPPALPSVHPQELPGRASESSDSRRRGQLLAARRGGSKARHVP